MEKEPGGKSIEELAAIQEEHEADIRRQKEQKEAEEEHQRQLQTQAGQEAVERQEALAEIKQQREQAEEMEAQQIKERMAQAEKLKGSKQEKEETLTTLQEEVARAQARVQGIEELISGKPKEVISEAVRENLEQARTDAQGLAHQAQDLEKEISRLGEQIVADEEVKRYQEIIGQLTQLDERMTAIEANPALIELLLKEAKTEDDVRERIIGTALQKARIQRTYPTDPRAKAFVEDVGQTFLTEEFAARGFGQIKNPQERLRQMSALAQDMIRGINLAHSQGHELHLLGPTKEQKNQYAGQLLLNLFGGCGTIGGTLNRLTDTEIGFSIGVGHHESAEEQKEAGIRAIKRHLGTLNLMRAYNFSLESHRHLETFLPAFGGDWYRDFDQYLRPGFDYESKGPIIPREAPEAEKQKIRTRFEEQKTRARKIEQDLKKEEEEKKQTQIEDLQAQIAELQEVKPKLEQAIRFLDEIRQPNQRDEWGKEINRLRGVVETQKRLIVGRRKDLDNTGVLSFRVRGSLRKEIDNEEHKRTISQLDIHRLETIMAQYDAAVVLKAKYKSVFETENNILRLQGELQKIQRGY